MADLNNRIYAHRLRESIYHEAGHAVAIALRGMHFDYVMVDLDGGGHVYADFFRNEQKRKRMPWRTFSPNWKENRDLYYQRDKSFLDSLAAICLSGLVADQIKFGTCNFRRAASDLHKFHLIAKRSFRGSFSGSRLLEMRKRVWNSCRNELSKQETWDWVERTALALYEKNVLKQDEVLDLRFPPKSRTDSKLKKPKVLYKEEPTVIYVDFLYKGRVSYDDLIC